MKYFLSTIQSAEGRFSFHSRTLKRLSSSMRSGSVPLCSRIPAMMRLRTLVVLDAKQNPAAFEVGERHDFLCQTVGVYIITLELDTRILAIA